MRRFEHPTPGYRAKLDNWIGINLLLGFVTIADGLFGLLFFQCCQYLERLLASKKMFAKH